MWDGEKLRLLGRERPWLGSGNLAVLGTLP